MKTMSWFNVRIAHVVIAIISATLIGVAFGFPAVTTTICDTSNGTKGSVCADLELYVYKVSGCMKGYCNTVSAVDGVRDGKLTYISNMTIGNHNFEKTLKDKLGDKVLLPFHIISYLLITSLFIACFLAVAFIVFSCIDVPVWACCCGVFLSMLVFMSCVGIGAVIIAISTLHDEVRISNNLAVAILIICGGFLQLLQAFLLSCFCCGQSTVRRHLGVCNDMEAVHTSPEIQQNNRIDRRFSRANIEMERSGVLRYSNVDSHLDRHNPETGDKVWIGPKPSDIQEANQEVRYLQSDTNPNMRRPQVPSYVPGNIPTDIPPNKQCDWFSNTKNNLGEVAMENPRSVGTGENFYNPETGGKGCLGPKPSDINGANRGRRASVKWSV